MCTHVISCRGSRGPILFQAKRIDGYGGHLGGEGKMLGRRSMHASNGCENTCKRFRHNGHGMSVVLLCHI